MAATESPRGKSQSHLLPDLSSSPIVKTWGHQRLLRCVNVNRKREIVEGERRSAIASSSSSRDRRAHAGGQRIRVPAKSEGVGEDEGLEELRAKLLGHLHEAARRMTLAVAPIGGEEAVAKTSPEMETEPSSSPAETDMPWNLRTRRGASKASVPVTSPSEQQAAEQSNQERSIRLRSENQEKRERPKFSISLSREEIEEDIFSLTGSRPRRRPKKRAKIVQRQLDSIFPGMWLSEITADSYKVSD